MSDETDGRGPIEILLIEDNPGDVRLTKEAFREGEVETTLHVASDGVEALDFLYRREGYADAPRPDIILLDLNLPRKAGEEVLEEIQDDTDLSRIPVIVLTSSQTKEDITKFYELQANAYLVKPVEPEEFVELARALEEFWFRFAELPTRTA
ncbi:response regulator [Halopelagius longus]|uniref:Response regulator n=1 Tax=Halopelagius longus TaxID=1236180 RepID=A0A1H1FI80_9EURY|nr:response regulator [Halopelagius longus]RDI70092.1 response regulator [Halopelagius longus]SDR00570.1 Response regulator receiver domain-containing protein [Halopelagius longus]